MNEQNRRRIVFRAVILCAAFLVLLLVAIRLMDDGHSRRFQEKRDAGTKEFMTSDVVVWEGEEYGKTPAVTTILVAGIDQDDDSQQGVGTSRYRAGGQADFLILLAIDHTHRQIHQLQIDRDTMAMVTVLGVYGQETGERLMQICLSHSYGAGKEENAQYTVKAVRKLLNDLPIDGYYMVDYSAVPVFNDALGGVTVTIPDDMTVINSLWQAGSSVTLHGKEAETFVRARRTVGEGTNEERMRRQSEYMQQAILRLRERLAADAGFGMQLLSELSANATTNLPEQELAGEIRDSRGYEVLPLEYLDGEYRHGDSGHMEFHLAENSVESWIMKHMYTKK